MNSASKISAKALKDNRKIKIFLFFLFLTSVIWFLIALSKTHKSTVLFKIDYVNVPKNKLLQNKPSSQLHLVLKGTGFNLLKYKFKAHKVSLNLKNVVKKEAVYYLLPNAQILELNNQLRGETEILEVLTDTIFIELGTNISKKVPVHPKLEVQFKLGYNLTEELKISPDSIVVLGPKKNLDSINEITTSILKLSDVYEDIDVVLNVKSPSKSKNVSVLTKSVKVKGLVDKFTEGSFILPVAIINIPDSVRINPFPKEIEVFYQVGLSNFSKISKKDIIVVFDFQQYKNDSLVKYLSPVVTYKSAYISSLKINPSQIEFLIQK